MHGLALADELEQVDLQLVGRHPRRHHTRRGGTRGFNGPCESWPAPSRSLYKVNGDGVQNALLIDETGDAATPFEGSIVVLWLFPHSVLLAEPGGTSHADSLFGDLCVDSTIAHYLQSGSLPTRKPYAAWDKTCKPIPVPVPPSSSSAANAAQSAAAHVLARQGKAVSPAQLPAVRVP